MPISLSTLTAQSQWVNIPIGVFRFDKFNLSLGPLLELWDNNTKQWVRIEEPEGFPILRDARGGDRFTSRMPQLRVTDQTIPFLRTWKVDFAEGRVEQQPAVTHWYDGVGSNLASWAGGYTRFATVALLAVGVGLLVYYVPRSKR